MTELNIISHVIGSGESRNFITKSVLGSFCKTAALLLAVSFGVVSPHASWAQGKPEDTGKEEAPRVKRERKAPQKPEKTTINSHAQHNVIVVKFQEGTHIRQRQGILMAESQKRSPEEKTKLQKAKLDDAKITAQLNKLDNLLQKHPRHGVRRLFSREEADLDRERDEGSPNSDEELADLNLYFHVVLDDVQAEESAALIDELNALDIIEIAYPAPIGEDSAADLWPTTGNYVGYQGYRNAAPNGIDANYAWSFAGGRGDGVKVIDIEQNWNLYHEDLNGVFHYSGTPSGDTKHGTAVLGVVAAAENSYGMSGITPR